MSPIEVLIALVTSLSVAGLTLPSTSSGEAESQAGSICQLVLELGDASTHYFHDTGALPREYRGWDGPSFHRLSEDPMVPGWKGPYIEQPIQESWNPCGGELHLFDFVVAHYAGDNGFDLDADGEGDVYDRMACILTLWNVTPRVAHGVDRRIDGQLNASWADTGRVEYQRTERRLTVLLVSLAPPK